MTSQFAAQLDCEVFVTSQIAVAGNPSQDRFIIII